MDLSNHACLVIAPLILTLAACATTPTTLGGDAHHVKLTFIEPNKAARVLAENPLESLPPDSREASIIKTCSGNTLQPAVAPVAALLGLVVSEVVDLGINEIDKTLQDALKKYVSTYQGNETIIPYSDSPTDFTFRYSCFRFSRGVNDADGKRSNIGLDLIAETRLAPEGDRLQIRPLRLLLAKPQVQSASGQFTIAISLKAESLWRDTNQGHEGVVFDKSILKESVKEPPPVYVKYYPTDDKAWIDFPIIPYSIPHSHSQTYGNAKMTLSVAENGVPSHLLQEVAKLFRGSKGTLEKLLKDSADKELGVSNK